MGTQIELIDVKPNAIRITTTEVLEITSGDCFDMVPETGIPIDFSTRKIFRSSPEDVHPNSSPVYDGIDQIDPWKRIPLM